MGTAHEHFSAQFAAWEMRGRGWQVYDRPIYPEPPFVPFTFRSMVEAPAVDDGRRQTFLSSLARKLAAPARPPAPVSAEPEPGPEPTPLIRGELVELQLALSEDLDMAKESFEQFLNGLALCREPVAFELLGSYRRVLAQFAAATEDSSLVKRQLNAHFPGVQVSERTATLQNAWTNSEGNEAFAIEFGLQHEFVLPLATGKLDPFVGIVAALSELRPGELGLFQVLWQPVQHPWAESITNSVTHPDGKPIFVNAPELAGAAEKKVAKPLFAVVVRIMVRTASRARLYEIARDLASSLRVYNHPQGNALIPIRNHDYPYLPHLEDVIYRRSRRAGMLLNSEELTGFVHLPSRAVRSPVLLRDAGLTKAAPGSVRQAGILIGDNEHNGEAVPVYLTPEQRVRHTHIIGSSGTGKSSLLLNLIQQDIQNGEGIAVLDPHGDLINQILGMIPDERVDDVVLVDPSDVDFPIGFNILSAHSDEEKSLLASDLIAVFRRLSTSWGDQMDTVLQNAILAILESKQGGTLSDLRLFLLDAKYRKQFLQTVTDPEIVFYWQNVFPQLTGGKSIGPVLTRLQDFFTRKPLRNMVGQQENKLDFADIMDSGKIFLARLPEGCGEENSYLLGTLLVSKFQQLAMARQSQQASARRDFWLYIDEFDHFITPSMAKILSAVRKYRLGSTLAHQSLHQLHSDPKVESAVMTQPCTRIVFKVGDDDAKKLGEGFESFDERSLKNLPKFHAIARVERNDCDFNLALRKPELPDDEASQSQREKIIAASRAKYATPRAEVEAALLARIWGQQPQPPPADESGGPPAPKPSPPRPPAPVVVPPPKDIPPPATVETPPPAITEVKPVTVSEKESKPVNSPAVATVLPVSPAAVKPAVAETKVPKERGRGFEWHKSAQKLIKTEGEKLGFSAELEKQLAKGSMQAADVVLRRGHVHIAVEIASTSSNINHEFENIHKCLKSGFSHVVAIASDLKFLQGLEAAVQGALEPELTAKVSYHTTAQFIEELRRLAAASELPPPAQPLAAKEVRGDFEIERTFSPASPETQQVIHDIVTRAITAPDKP
jgi:Type IV secretion-system coupling protein DNA-binding domain